MFEQILNWKLLAGGHKFPGPDGGTCINEAAVVAAGLPYRLIRFACDCPPCFSRTISEYAIRINDAMPDDLRHELLMPFVMRLAGTADTRAVERARADVMVVRTVNTILPIVLRLHKLEAHTTRCERVFTRNEAYLEAGRVREVLSTATTAYIAAAAKAGVPERKAYYAAGAASMAVADVTISAAVAACVTYNPSRDIWTKAVDILDAALRIGRQTEPVEVATVVSRMDVAKRNLLTTG
jgi:hypothetical protein